MDTAEPHCSSRHTTWAVAWSKSASQTVPQVRPRLTSRRPAQGCSPSASRASVCPRGGHWIETGAFQAPGKVTHLPCPPVPLGGRTQGDQDHLAWHSPEEPQRGHWDCWGPAGWEDPPLPSLSISLSFWQHSSPQGPIEPGVNEHSPLSPTPQSVITASSGLDCMSGLHFNCLVSFKPQCLAAPRYVPSEPCGGPGTGKNHLPR